MTTISVPIPGHLEEIIKGLVKKGYANNKAEVVRKALVLLAEEEAVNAVLKAEQEVGEGKILRGDLKKLMKKLS